MDLKIIYEDSDILVIDKPAGIIVFPEGEVSAEKTVIDFLVEKYPDLKNVGEAPRYGIVHRLDKDTSGILLVAKNNESLTFLQNQFSAGARALMANETGQALEKRVEKKYITLVCGNVKNDHGTIHTLIARSKSDPRKQTAHSLEYKGKTGLREAITEYKVLERYESPTSQRLRGVISSEYTLLEIKIKTGRKHQIRCHMAYLKNPVAGDKIYGFKDSPKPEGLERQFLHAGYLKIQLPSGQIKEFHSDLPEDLQAIITNLK